MFPDDFTDKFYKILKELFCKLFQITEEGTLPNSFDDFNITLTQYHYQYQEYHKKRMLQTNTSYEYRCKKFFNKVLAN